MQVTVNSIKSGMLTYCSLNAIRMRVLNNRLTIYCDRDIDATMLNEKRVELNELISWSKYLLFDGFFENKLVFL